MNVTGHNTIVRSSTIFVSYARRDGLDHAKRLNTALSKHGFATWMDLRNIDPDLDFTAEIEMAIERSTRVVCCITPDVTRSKSFVRREIGYAIALGKPVVPLIFEDSLPPISIINVTREDFTHTTWDAALSRLISRLNRDEKNSESTDDFDQYLGSLYRAIVLQLRQLVFTEIELSVDMVTYDTQTGIHDFDALSPSFGRQRLPAAVGAPLSKSLPLRKAFSVAGRRLLLLGNPGAGKTVSLLALARDLVAERLDNPSRPLPLLAQIFKWDPTSTGLTSWLSGQIPMLSEEKIEQLILRKEALLILEGLDELPSRKELPKKGIINPRKLFLAQLPSSVQLLVSSRISEWREVQQDQTFGGTAQICGFDDHQLADYLKSSPILWRSLENDQQLKELARTPLFLSILRYAYSDINEGADLQFGRGGSFNEVQEIVFDKYINRRIEHERARSSLFSGISAEQLYETLGQVAFSQASKDPVIDNLQNISISKEVVALAGAHAYDFLEYAIVLQLLVRNGSGDVQFSHMLLRRHFGRKTCLKLWDYTTSWPYRKYIDKAKEAFTAMTKLAWFGDKREVDTLIQIANDKDSYVRAHVAMALGGIGHQRGAETLCQLLSDKHKWHIEAAVCDIACWALIQTGESALQALSKQIETGADSHVTALILLIVSRIRSDSARKVVGELEIDGRKIDKSYKGSIGSEIVGYYIQETTIAELAKKIHHRIQENLPPIYGSVPFLRLPDSKPWRPYGYSTQ